MAELTFLGAAGTVTGSKHLVRSGDLRFLLDCGLFQGGPEVEALNGQPLPFEPATLDAVVISHGHLDHVGYLPKLVHDGYRGPIYCTPATAGVMQIVLEDSANLQAHLAARGFHHESASRTPMLYDRHDVAATMALVEPVPLEQPWDAAGATFRYRDAGHILGAAFVEVTVERTRLVFSGDVGRYATPLLADPSPIGDADVLVCESTYGDRRHEADAVGTLHRILTDALARGGVIVIPAFAVERTQAVLATLGTLQRRDPHLAEIPVHVDSPMGERVSELFGRFRDAHAPTDEPQATFGCRNVRVHVTPDDSKQLNRIDGPAIVIASSGMASGGRVLYHLHRRLHDPRSTIVFAGYQSVGTLGHALVHGATHVRLFGDRVVVRAHVDAFDGLSAHADRDELLRWIGTARGVSRFYAVHGEPPAAAALCAAVNEQLHLETHVAAFGMTVPLGA